MRRMKPIIKAMAKSAANVVAIFLIVFFVFSETFYQEQSIASTLYSNIQSTRIFLQQIFQKTVLTSIPLCILLGGFAGGNQKSADIATKLLRMLICYIIYPFGFKHKF